LSDTAGGVPDTVALRQQLRKMFHVFIYARACSTQVRIRLCTVLRWHSCIETKGVLAMPRSAKSHL
jgi:hypothetical protein